MKSAAAAKASAGQGARHQAGKAEGAGGKSGAAAPGKGGAAAGGKPKPELRRQGSNLKRSESLGGYDRDSLQPVEVKRVPADQVKGLSPEQLSEVFNKSINSTNPNAPKSVARFNYKAGEFRSDPAVSHLTVHFHMDSTLIHVDSDEARRDRGEPSWLEEGAAAGASAGGAGGSASEAAATAEAQAGPDGADDDGGDSGSPKAGLAGERAEGGASSPAPGKMLRNQFNFSERASQTFNHPMRDREVATEPPPTRSYNGSVTQWEIFDAYLAQLLQQRAAARGEAKPSSAAASSSSSSAPAAGGGGAGGSGALMPSRRRAGAAQPEENALQRPGLQTAIKVMERMVNQNSQSDLYHDFRFFEDEADAVREDGKGDFHQLWKFGHPEARRLAVTSVVWNPEFTDLFAVSYGSYEFARPTPGMICCYSLKNTPHPEYVFRTDSGVMCLDFHPQHSALLAAGLYDGTVCVFDVRSKDGRPIFVSSDPKVKHTDPVWQVRWQPNDANQGINFCAVSSDGRVTSWTMNKSELVMEEVAELKISAPLLSASMFGKSASSSSNTAGATAAASGSGSGSDPDSPLPKVAGGAGDGGPQLAGATGSAGTQGAASGPASPAEEDAALVGLAGGSCFDFNRKNPDLFIVGTEEGSITAYNKAFHSQPVESYAGHHMAVYTVRWSPFNDRVFLSCSADWTVKLWEQSSPEPVMTFDLGNAVGDVAWSPYSATVFASVTNDGKVRVYDLSVNKHEPIGETRVAKKTRLTHVVFNPREPIVMVGDDTGGLVTLKLSPNLRKMSAAHVADVDRSTESARLDALLASIGHEPRPAGRSGRPA